tara:strand:- start:3573 stop:3692 length:120 start_codon:yes stop_codon:yes gene_type:complete
LIIQPLAGDEHSDTIDIEDETAGMKKPVRECCPDRLVQF